MTALRIIQRPKLGAVKVALVSATCPEGRMLLVVFKGTSFIADFLNWNLEHDHTMTKDKAFFIHRGAAGAMGNLQFWLETDFMRRLESEGMQGVAQVVFAGHSLGGMYAQVMLYLAWQKIEAGGLTPLMSSMRCVTFGAPMTFGGGLEGNGQLQSFKSFANRRAVNYVHAHDPCPRAWGSLNLRVLVQQACQFTKQSLRDELGTVQGGSQVLFDR